MMPTNQVGKLCFATIDNLNSTNFPFRNQGMNFSFSGTEGLIEVFLLSYDIFFYSIAQIVSGYFQKAGRRTLISATFL